MEKTLIKLIAVCIVLLGLVEIILWVKINGIESGTKGFMQEQVKFNDKTINLFEEVRNQL